MDGHELKIMMNPMLVNSIENRSCDVLVIGAGGAGLRSAIAARTGNADVLLASKTKIGPNSNTYISKAVIAASGWGTPDDNAHAHLEDTVAGGRFLNDQSMVAKVAERAHSEIDFLKACGAQFHMHGGRHHVIKIPGHRYARHVYGSNWSGRDLIVPLKNQAEQAGVRFVEHLFITRLMAAGRRICGAAGITADGRFYAIRAKAVILATGGYAQIYLNTNNVPGITGDGQALAYGLGIALKDMEFVQFYPTAAGKHGSRLILYEKMLAQPGVVLRNRKGEDILKRHGIEDPTTITRDRLARLLTDEINTAGTPDQKIVMDMEALAEKRARSLTAILPSRWWKGQKVFKVAPTTHFCMGGIVTDQCGETTVKGLFATGEAAAGVHGANRLGGNALAEIFTMGSWVGESAAERIKAIGAAPTSKNAYEDERCRLDGAFSRKGASVKPLIQELKQLMWTHAGVIRHESELKQALAQLQKELPDVAVTSPADLIRLLEFKNMRCVAQMVCRAALERTESRGSHYRSDYPAEDNRRWLANIVLRKSQSGVHIETTPVNMESVKMDL
jgi:succinate dehydrogenase/fumarate reductase flavoprotein subunit